LRRYFDQHRDELLGLGSSSLRLLFDDLFQVNSEEAKTYVRSSGAKITKASSNLRLGEGAAALRSLVASTVNFMPKKQAVAVIEHVTQMLQMDREGFLAPVELDYLRILRTVLEYQPHGEHLGKVAKKDNSSQWQALMSFCLAGLEENHDWSSTTRLQASRASSQRGAISPVCNELLGCLKGLLAATNAPLFNEGDRAVRAVLKVLKDVTSQSNISMSEGFSSGLAIVRFVLSRISSSNSMLVTEVIGDTLLVSSRLLISANRLTAVREEILMIVLILQPHLMNVVARSARADFREQVDALASALFDDYVDDSPSNKQRLDLDDVDLGLRNRISIDAMPLQRSVFTLRPDTREVELYWTQLHMTAFCQGWVDADATTPRRPGGYEEEGRATASDDEFEGRAKNTASKRRRVGTKLESMLDRLKRAGTIERVRILQIICFSLDMCDLSVSSMLDFATQLLDYAVEKDGQVASWAFLCLSL
jgi:ataxia telangiectasia mutated family protein